MIDVICCCPIKQVYKAINTFLILILLLKYNDNTK